MYFSLLSMKKILLNTNTAVRINRRMSELGIATRNTADELIEKGKVFVNGKVAQLGMKVRPTDTISIDGSYKKDFSYFAYNKPASVVTVGASAHEKAVKDVADFDVEVFPVGRLDKDSSGLLIMTNDGRVTDKLLNPTKIHEKEYRVMVDKKITHQFLAKMREGVRISPKEKTKPAKIRRVEENIFDIVLTEGKNRQIRKMCGSLGYKVQKLERFRIENIELGNIRPNEHEEISGKTLEEFLTRLGIK